jgi:hypothetical protein
VTLADRFHAPAMKIDGHFWVYNDPKWPSIMNAIWNASVEICIRVKYASLTYFIG